VEYAGNVDFYSCDPSTIPAEWHLWLHNSTEDAPTEVSLARRPERRRGSLIVAQTSTGSTKDLEYVKTVEQSDAIFKKNLGGVVAPHTRNNSSTRPRAYGVGNGSWSEPGEEKFYTQPGFALDPRNKHPRPARRAWTLADTAETFRARQKLVAHNAAVSSAGTADAMVHDVVPTFGLPASLPYSEEESEFVADTNGTWSLQDAYDRVKELEDTIQELEEVAEFNPRQTEDALESARADLGVARRHVRLIESISAKWAEAGGVGTVHNGLP
jgi:hypothetical protein